jgi:hypothetical protein
MSIITRSPNKKNKVAQGVAVLTKNGLPVDSYLTLEGTNPLYKGEVDPIVSYSAPVVTVPAQVDLEQLRLASTRYTGKLVLITESKKLYFIDRLTMNNATKTFEIFEDADFTSSPTSINQAQGWVIAEANLVNKLATTSTAHFDEVEFNGFDVSFNLDAATDSVRVQGNNGNTIEPNADGSVNIVGEIEADVALDAGEGDTVAISRHQYPFEAVQEYTRTAAQLSATTFTQVYSYNNTLPALRIKCVKADCNTYGEYRVLIDGQLKDKFRTSPAERNCRISFTEELDLPQGQNLTLEFRPERIRLTEYQFFTRLEGYQELP